VREIKVDRGEISAAKEKSICSAMLPTKRNDRRYLTGLVADHRELLDELLACIENSGDLKKYILAFP
jgi:hypothetical protein